VKNTLLGWLFLAAAGTMPSQGHALSTSMGPMGLGASSLGAGGVGVATASASEALFWNPAAMPDQGWDLGYSVGSGGALGSLDQALALAGDLGEGLHAGLLVSDLRFNDSGGFRESQFAGAASVSAGRWLSIGTVQRLHQAEPGGLRGWSMDAGALAGMPLPGGWALRLGGSAGDLVSSLAWQNGLEEQQPTTLRLGAALEARPGTWLAFQSDQLDRSGGSGDSQWRAGAQAALFDQSLFLRAGATAATNGGLYYTAGLGGHLSFGGQGLSVDYALLVPSDTSNGAALRHVAALRWQLQPGRREPAAGISNLIKDPNSGKVRHARIALAEGPKDTQAWQLDLKDEHGHVVRSFKGSGPLPPSVAWDGKDDAGATVDAGGLSYDLRTTSSNGRTAQRRSLLAPAGQALGNVDQDLANVEDSGFGLRSGGGAAAAPVRAKPRLRSGGEQVQGADFDLRGLQSGDAEGGEWSVRIRDESGRTVKEIKGHGSIPKTVRWEGKDDLGRPVDVGLGASYEIRVTDASGKERVSEDDLVHEESLPKAKPARASVADSGEAVTEASGDGLPASGCKVVGGKVVCTFHFAEGSSKLPEQSRSVIEEARFLSSGRHGLRLFVDGHADASEAQGMELSQARADAVLRDLVEGRSLDFDAMVATGLGARRPAGQGAASNRRVVLFIESQAAH
jgi:outer membrane protein OmpA-like peptidoglycan-associated protein